MIDRIRGPSILVLTVASLAYFVTLKIATWDTWFDYLQVAYRKPLLAECRLIGLKREGYALAFCAAALFAVLNSVASAALIAFGCATLHSVGGDGCSRYRSRRFCSIGSKAR